MDKSPVERVACEGRGGPEESHREKQGREPPETTGSGLLDKSTCLEAMLPTKLGLAGGAETLPFILVPSLPLGHSNYPVPIRRIKSGREEAHAGVWP